MILIAMILAQSIAPPITRPKVAATDRKAKMICVEEAPLGSRLGARKICRSAQDWARDRQEVRDDTEQAQRQVRTLGGN